jgi:ATP-dependent Clp protease ATP-binding subunit ClpC
VVTAFVARRVAAGESPSAAELDEAVDPARREVVDIVVRSLEGTLPAATYRDLRRSETRRFLESIGRVWEGPQGMPALTSVGGRDAAVLAVHEALGQVPPYSLLLVGEHGTGKSAVLRTALTELLDEGWLVFEAGAPEIHAGCQYIGQMESRVREIATHAAGARIVWIFPQFEGALWEGQHARSPRGLLDMLMPFVESGRLVLVGEVEPEAYELLIRQRRRVASLFEVLRLDPLTPDEAIAVARDWRDRVGADIDDATIDEAHELAQHYLAGIAAPAGLLRLLKAAVGARDPQLPVRTEHVLATLSEATGLPLHVVDAEMPLDLDEVRTFFATRVLGQREAVDCLVDRIALTKAKLTDPTRPLGVFLFVGPTGTGKTEIAKALAEFLFGSADRLVRLDMTEFQTPESLERLLADAAAADEAAPLISAVRAKPFSVVLLDEF